MTVSDSAEFAYFTGPDGGLKQRSIIRLVLTLSISFQNSTSTKYQTLLKGSDNLLAVITCLTS